MFVEKIITKTGYVETTLPFPYYNQLLQNINQNPPTQPHNQYLAGQIENEKTLNLSLIPDEIKETIIEGCYEYIDKFGHNKFRKNNEKWNLKFVDIWINFQKAGEYNPIHHHTNDLVFVIWLQIPYKLQEELKQLSSINSNSDQASKFQFANINNFYSHIINNVISVDKSYEGKMIVFHAQMDHCVYPFFTSDDYRISMSGNLDIVFDA